MKKAARVTALDSRPVVIREPEGGAIGSGGSHKGRSDLNLKLYLPKDDQGRRCRCSGNLIRGNLIRERPDNGDDPLRDSGLARLCWDGAAVVQKAAIVNQGTFLGLVKQIRQRLKPTVQSGLAEIGCQGESPKRRVSPY